MGGAAGTLLPPARPPPPLGPPGPTGPPPVRGTLGLPLLRPPAGCLHAKAIGILTLRAHGELFNIFWTSFWLQLGNFFFCQKSAAKSATPPRPKMTRIRNKCFLILAVTFPKEAYGERVLSASFHPEPGVRGSGKRAMRSAWTSVVWQRQSSDPARFWRVCIQSRSESRLRARRSARAA